MTCGRSSAGLSGHERNNGNANQELVERTSASPLLTKKLTSLRLSRQIPAARPERSQKGKATLRRRRLGHVANPLWDSTASVGHARASAATFRDGNNDRISEDQRSLEADPGLVEALDAVINLTERCRGEHHSLGAPPMRLVKADMASSTASTECPSASNAPATVARAIAASLKLRSGVRRDTDCLAYYKVRSKRLH